MGDRVLAIRLRALGDVVLTTPALRALKRGFPDAALDVVTERRYAPLLEGLEGIDHVWGLERSRAATWSLVRQLRRQRYRVAVDFFGNPRSALLTAWSRAQQKAGYDVRGRSFVYDVRVARDLAPGPGRREYAADTHLRLAAAVGGVGADGADTRVAIQPAARQRAERLVAAAGLDAGLTVGLVAAGTWFTKTWPASNAAMLARRLMGAGWRVLLISGPGEECASATMTALAPGTVVLPPCDIPTLVAVIAGLAAVVGNDSGPRHVAAALGVPTFAWFGPTHPDNWTPPASRHGFWRTPLPCGGCNRTACPHWSCLPALSAEQAATLVLAHLERHVRNSADLGPAARA